MNVLNERYATITEVKKILKDKVKVYKEEDKEELYEQKRALKHAKKFAALSMKEAEKLKNELGELDLSLSEAQIVKICDLLPATVDDVRAIFASERFRYSEEEIKKITGLVSQYKK
jgi:DNA-directed RNA polymerase subunit F